MAEQEQTPSVVSRFVATFIAPASVTGAVLYYFGWLRSQTIAQELGYDASILDYGPQDYVLRSVQPLASLAVLLAIVGWPLFLVHRRFVARARAKREWWKARPWLARRLIGLGGLATAAAFRLTLLGFDRASLLLPLCFVVAAGLVGYGAWLRGFADAMGLGPFRLSPPMAWLVTSLLVAGGFSATSYWARSAGRQQAADNIAQARSAPVATLTSATPLLLAGVPSHQEGDSWVTTGLTLLFSAGGRHFLLPVDYDPATNARIYTVDAAAVRIDFDRSTVVPCSGFEDLTEGATFGPGQVITSGQVRYRVVALGPVPTLAGTQLQLTGPGTGDPPAGATPETTERVTATVTVERSAEEAEGLVLHLRHAALEPEYRAPFLAWTLRYGQRASGVKLQVNGAEVAATTVVGLADQGAFDGVATVEVAGRAGGTLRVQGGDERLYRMVLGGTDLILDCDPVTVQG